jgi:hypothetical protein
VNHTKHILVDTDRTLQEIYYITATKPTRLMLFREGFICMHICSYMRLGKTLFVCIFVHICVYSFHMCYTRFGAYPNYMRIRIIVKKQLIGKKEKRKRGKKNNSRDRD